MAQDFLLKVKCSRRTVIVYCDHIWEIHLSLAPKSPTSSARVWCRLSRPWLMALSLLQGTGVDGKKFAAGCINAVLNGIDLWACLISLESLDGRRRSVWAGMMQESKSERGRAIWEGVKEFFIIWANSITHMTLSHRLQEEIEYFDLSFMYSGLATHNMGEKIWFVKDPFQCSNNSDLQAWTAVKSMVEYCLKCCCGLHNKWAHVSILEQNFQYVSFEKYSAKLQKSSVVLSEHFSTYSWQNLAFKSANIRSKNNKSEQTFHACFWNLTCL